MSLLLKIKWKDIPDCDGYYKASIYGKIRSVTRLVITKNNKRRVFKGQLLKPAYDSDGYAVVSISSPRMKGLKKVHQLVLLTFVGPPKKSQVTRHRDGNNRNNFLFNLRWGTTLKNQQDRAKHGRGPQGERNGRAKLSKNKIRKAKRLRRRGWSIERLANRFRVNVSTIYRALNNHSWNKGE
jgi:hypothetical protein